MNRLVLASHSPRRRELIGLLGHPFSAEVSGVEEVSVAGETPAEHVTRLSLLKARDVADRYTDGIVIGSDTIVVIDGDVLEKPSSPEEAVEMIMQLQGRTHKVFTGFALVDASTGRETASFETTLVTIRPMSLELAQRYVATGEPLDKAGAYGIQGYGAAIVTGINGCYFTVMGLPVARLAETLNDFTDGRFGCFGAKKR